MAEKSMYWYTDGFTGAIGDGSAPYTQEEQRAHESALFGEGVVAGTANELAVSGVATPLSVATGRAQVAGFHYWNDDVEELSVTTPSVGTTGGRVVLRADWTTATTRLAVLLNTDGVSAIPALTQTVGVTYEISLASFTVTTGGVIALTDTRQYVGRFNARQGGDASDWGDAGATNYSPSNHIIQAGSTSYSSGGQVTVTFPRAFSGTPVLTVTDITGTVPQVMLITGISATQFTVAAYTSFIAASSVATFNWIAVGPA